MALDVSRRLITTGMPANFRYRRPIVSF